MLALRASIRLLLAEVLILRAPRLARDRVRIVGDGLVAGWRGGRRRWRRIRADVLPALVALVVVATSTRRKRKERCVSHERCTMWHRGFMYAKLGSF